MTIGTGGAGGAPTSTYFGMTGHAGGTSTFSCTKSEASVNAPGGVGGPGGAGGVNPSGTQSGAFQTYPGQSGQGPTLSSGDLGGGLGGGIGYPGTGGTGGFIRRPWTQRLPGYAIITPVG